MLKDINQYIKSLIINIVDHEYKNNIGSISNIFLIKNCPSMTFRIETKQNKIFIAKVSSNVDFLSFQKFYTSYLKEHIGVQTVVSTDDGRNSCPILILNRNYHLVLKTYISGKKLDTAKVYDSFCLGEGLGKLHLFSEGIETIIKIKHTRKELLSKNLLNMLPHFNRYGNIEVSAESQLLKIIEKLNILEYKYDLKSKLLKSRFIHGDISSENCLLTGGEVSFIDFDNCCYGSRFFDIGAIKWELSFGGKLNKESWNAFSQGYKSALPTQIPLADILIDYCLIYKEFEVILYYMELVEYVGVSYLGNDFPISRLKFIESLTSNLSRS